jgi:predicted DsbA family dithiol-disulfide isomerase
VEHCAFELHPGIPLEGQAIPWPPERLAAASSRFGQIAEAEGLPYRQRTHWYNSVPAHEAALWADAQGNGEAFRRAVYGGYFADLENIGSADVLSRIAESVGLPSDDLRDALASGRFHAEVEGQFQYAREVGITGVPAYVAGRYLMVGAQPDDVFRQLIDSAIADQTTH